MNNYRSQHSNLSFESHVYLCWYQTFFIVAIPYPVFYWYFNLWEFFTSASPDGFPHEFEWQQDFSSLHDSSQYSDRSQLCCSLDSLHPSRYFQLLQSLYQSFGDCTKSTNYNWYNRHFHVLQFFNSLARSRYLSLFSHPFNSTLCSAGTLLLLLLLLLLLSLLLFFYHRFLVVNDNNFCHIASILFSILYPTLSKQSPYKETIPITQKITFLGGRGFCS